jgi:3-oxoacyl-[acyl-carrier protein] reductase
MFGLEGKIVVVTGSARGIGKEIAKHFLRHKAKVVISDISEEITQQAIKELKSLGDVLGISCNVTDYTQVENLIEKTVEHFGKIDVLINNAGITKDGIFVRMTEADWDAVVSVNLKGVFNCSQVAIKQMMKQKYGNIVNMSSIIGIMGNPGQANYSATKGAVISLTKTLAKEYASRNIRVNAIAPGFIDTAMTQAIPEAEKNKMVQAIPLKKLGLPEDVANAALFFASDLSKFVTAQVLVVDGGMI